MTYKIVSDSASNVLQFTGAPFASVPLKIITTQAEFTDDANLNVASMVEQVKNTKGKSGTSCPNIYEWIKAFGDADCVFAVTITSNLSGSCAAAKQAAEEYCQKKPGAKAYVIDTLSAGPEMRLIIEQLAAWIGEGLSFEEICEAVKAYMKRTHLLFSLESLTNLARNGRVNPAVAKIAGVLGIRIVGAASEVGTLQQLHKCRGEKKALETIVEEMTGRGFAGGKVRIAHCLNLQAAEDLKARICSAFPESNVELEQTTGLCSFYAELGGLMIGFESV